MELEEEELVAPVRPQRITRNMRSGELLKLQRETSKAILSHLIYDMEEKESEATVRYEGDSAAYRLWERAVISVQIRSGYTRDQPESGRIFRTQGHDNPLLDASAIDVRGQGQGKRLRLRR